MGDYPLTKCLFSQTCRQRKLKCDETKPICAQCRKGSRECVPSDGVVFRHQQNASMNGSGEKEEGGKLGGFYSYKNTFNEKNVWVDIPKKGNRHIYSLGKALANGLPVVTFLNITDPFNMEATPEPDIEEASTTDVPQIGEPQPESYFPMSFDQASGLEALSAAATSSYQYIRPLSVSRQSQGDSHASPHASNNLNFILNPAVPERSFGV